MHHFCDRSILPLASSNSSEGTGTGLRRSLGLPMRMAMTNFGSRNSPGMVFARSLAGENKLLCGGDRHHARRAPWNGFQKLTKQHTILLCIFLAVADEPTGASPQFLTNWTVIVTKWFHCANLPALIGTRCVVSLVELHRARRWCT